MDMMGADSYIQSRVEQYQGWYDARAQTYKRAYRRIRYTQLIASTLIVALSSGTLIAGDLTLLGLDIDQISRVLIVIFGLIVTIVTSLENTFRPKDLWRTYRMTEQVLQSEKLAFLARQKGYSGLSDDDAFSQFFNVVEEQIISENKMTLDVQTSA
ncbi:MAG: DUF4231 domain-containing protein [Pseudomonadota bacterium]